MLAVTVRGQAGRSQVKAFLAAGDEVDQRRGQHAPYDLGNDVGRQLPGRKPPAHVQAQRNGRVQVATRDMPDGERHGQHRQAERQGNPQHANP
ncbi:hypothetical protein D3C80_1921460 [compost metagenome]